MQFNVNTQDQDCGKQKKGKMSLNGEEAFTKSGQNWSEREREKRVVL